MKKVSKPKKSKTNENTNGEKKVKRVHIAPPKWAIAELRIKSKEGSPMAFANKNGIEDFLEKEYLTSMDPRKARGIQQDLGLGKTDKIPKIILTKEVMLKLMQASMYFIGNPKNKKYGLPATGFLKSMVEIAKDMDGVAGTQIKRNIKVLPNAEGLVELHCSEPHLDKSIGSVGPGKTPLVIARGMVDSWYVNLRIEFNQEVFTLQDIMNLIYTAGMCDGFGAQRLSKGGTYGAYTICPDTPVKVKELKFANVQTN